MNKKETYWLIVTILLLIVIFYGISGFRSFDSLEDTQITLHDTYFVITTNHLLILITNLIFFGVYLFRMLYNSFKNLTANMIFMVSCISLILIFTYLISILHTIQAIPNPIEYAQLNGGIVENAGNGWNNGFYVLLFIQLILIFLLTLSGIKTGMKMLSR